MLGITFEVQGLQNIPESMVNMISSTLEPETLDLMHRYLKIIEMVLLHCICVCTFKN